MKRRKTWNALSQQHTLQLLLSLRHIRWRDDRQERLVRASPVRDQQVDQEGTEGRVGFHAPKQQIQRQLKGDDVDLRVILEDFQDLASLLAGLPVAPHVDGIAVTSP